MEISDVELANRRCMECHGQARIGEMPQAERTAMVGLKDPGKANGPAARPGLFFSSPLLSGVHKGTRCVDCHLNMEQLPHPQTLKPADCNATCHAQPMAVFAKGAHAKALAAGNKDAPTCKTCHGTHAILPADDRNAPTYPLNIVNICANCHVKHQPLGEAAQKPGSAMLRETRSPVKEYLDSAHGRAVMSSGMAIAATCASCHDAHATLPAADPNSTVNRANVPETCGKCHVGVAETYATSIHGELLAKGDAKAPVCTDCHAAHAITRTNVAPFKLDIVNGCGTCHDKKLPGGSMSLYESYRRSYHGQVTQLGFERAARCSDCHGAHNIKAVIDPASSVAGGNLVTTCRKCHTNADAKFAEFHPHADHRDFHRYPILFGVWMYFVVMMSASFGFFGLHCIFWYVRSLIERLKHGAHPPIAKTGVSIERFNRIDRINHAFVIISFFGLTLTGLPLLFSDQHWGQLLAASLGGVKSAGVLHRVFAIMLIANFVVHGVGILRRIRKHGLINLLFGPATMMPTLKDLKDISGMIRWFAVGGQKPKFDRWTYWEKFDYTAEVGGSGIIGASGLLLWFPEFFSRFLPGWIFNVASIVHGYEAMLAICFIFTIHFFNAHLRLEKFPVDDVMFTGRLPEEEFKHERGAEYERLLASGELEKMRVPAPPSWYRPAAVTAGVLAMVIGTTLVVLIVLAGLGWI